jgi:hypothetical protein
LGGVPIKEASVVLGVKIVLDCISKAYYHIDILRNVNVFVELMSVRKDKKSGVLVVENHSVFILLTTNMAGESAKI